MMTALLPQEGQGETRRWHDKWLLMRYYTARSNIMKAFGAPSVTTDAKNKKSGVVLVRGKKKKNNQKMFWRFSQH